MKYILLLAALMVCSCNDFNKLQEQKYLENHKRRLSNIELGTSCKWSTKFNACFCVYFIGETPHLGITFAPASVCDGEESGTTP